MNPAPTFYRCPKCGISVTLMVAAHLVACWKCQIAMRRIDEPVKQQALPKLL